MIDIIFYLLLGYVGMTCSKALLGPTPFLLLGLPFKKQIELEQFRVSFVMSALKVVSPNGDGCAEDAGQV